MAAGTELREVQLAEIRSPFLYLGTVPEMIGPWSGRSETWLTWSPSSLPVSPLSYPHLQLTGSFRSWQFGRVELLQRPRIGNFPLSLAGLSSGQFLSQWSDVPTEYTGLGVRLRGERSVLTSTTSPGWLNTAVGGLSLGM